MSVSEFWSSLDARKRFTLAAGAALIVIGVAAAGVFLMQGHYQVLFSGMKPQDASVMVTELEKQKIPYRLEAEGSAILVPSDMVHRTRIRLLGQDLPLHGAVGFELFNNSDFGMTEFAQRVNYQRALQGEITRTILSLSNVESARVLIALPEQGLFHRGAGLPTASIAVALRDGRNLSPDQVLGIQRLVSAAIPDIETRNVTIVNQNGVALTATVDDAESGMSTDARLSIKRSTEEYLARKVAAVLDQTFGPGVAVASVDVLLNMDRVKVTKEDVLPYSPAGKGQPTGVVTRERRSSQEGEQGPGLVNGRRSGAGTDSETDYAIGRKVEEIVSIPGVITRMGVTAIVRTPLDSMAQERLRTMVGNAAGAQLSRGDSIVVYTAEQVSAKSDRQTSGLSGDISAPGYAQFEWTPRLAIAFVMAIGGVLLLLVLVLTWRRVQGPKLSADQREQVLSQLRQWLDPAKSGATEKP